MPLPMIDTHVHIWDLQRAAYNWLEGNSTILNRTYTIDELMPQTAAAGVTEGILVQAACNPEDTALMLETAAATPWIKGVVGWLPLTDTARTEQLLAETYSHEPCFKGVRHLIHDENDVRWLLQGSVIESLRVLARYGLPYDVVGVLPEHIETVLEVAQRVPELRMVFDHMNQPPVGTEDGTFGRWGQLMREAARHEQFYVKISGLGTAAAKAQWDAADIAPFVTFALEQFGEDRCFMGGDWPVSLLAGDYVSTWQKYRSALEATAGEQVIEKIACSNARHFYNI